MPANRIRLPPAPAPVRHTLRRLRGQLPARLQEPERRQLQRPRLRPAQPRPQRRRQRRHGRHRTVPSTATSSAPSATAADAWAPTTPVSRSSPAALARTPPSSPCPGTRREFENLAALVAVQPVSLRALAETALAQVPGGIGLLETELKNPHRLQPR
ncbi:hypothetical protein ACU686_16270 [Yinghuangia aomiensis]